MVARALILLLPLTAAAQVYDIPIKLTTKVEPKPTHYMCVVDGVHFQVPSRIIESGDEFILKVPVKKQIDGVWKTYTVQLGLPWQRGLCEAMKGEWRSTSQ